MKGWQLLGSFSSYFIFKLLLNKLISGCYNPYLYSNVKYSGADGGLCLRKGEEQVLTPSASEGNRPIDCYLLSCHQGTKGALETTLHVRTSRNLAAG